MEQFEPFALLGGRCFRQRNLGRAEDEGQRRAELVADVREEGGLGPIKSARASARFRSSS